MTPEKEQKLREAAENIIKDGGWWPYHDTALNARIPTKYVLEFMIRLAKSTEVAEYNKLEVDVEKLEREFYAKFTNEAERSKYANPENAPPFTVKGAPYSVFHWFLTNLQGQQESDAVEFQNWLFKNRYYETNAFGKHIQTFEHGTIGEPVVKTTQALYTEYLNQNQKTK